MPRGRRIIARRHISSIASPSSLSISTHASNVAGHSTEKNRRTAQVSGMKSDNAGSTMSQVRPPASSSRIRTRGKQATKQEQLHRAKAWIDERRQKRDVVASDDTSNLSPQKSSSRGTPRKMSACEKKNACAKAKQWSDDRKKSRAVNSNNNNSSAFKVKFRCPMTEMIN
jgi:hypothetical protein